MAMPDGGDFVGEVRVRFATEPSRYLQLSHAKDALLNKLFAERFNGELIVRFDDTNPARGFNECEAAILKDIETLGISYQRVMHASDYFRELMLMAERLIREDKAYVDDTDRDRLRQERLDGIESRCRSHSVGENLELWKEMVLGTERGLKCCLRGKLDMQNPNRSLRDPVYYRCRLVQHHRVGSYYKVYPTHHFASPYIDSKQGITHVFRSSGCGCNALYRRVLMDMGLEEIRIYECSNLNTFCIPSKCTLLEYVKLGIVDGWDDPRLPTVQGIVRKGLKPEALYQYVTEQGASNRVSVFGWNKLWAINRKLFGPVCLRHTAVIKERRVLFTLTNGPSEPFVRMVPRHKKHESAGLKETTFSKSIWIDQADAMAMFVNEEVSLMDWGNAIVKEIIVDQEDGLVTAITGILHLEGSVKTTKLKLTWLSDSSELVSLTLTKFVDLVVEKGYAYPSYSWRTEGSRKEVLAFGDSNMKHLKRGDVVRLERKGYFKCDVPCHTGANSLVLFAIPDSKKPFSRN